MQLAQRTNAPTTYRNALQAGSMLHEYRLDRVLGAGGFGVTYLAWDCHLEKQVAIKEYLPGACAQRALDGSVFPVNSDHDASYRWGLERFLQEARTLARFSHPNIVRVNRFFELNGTGYMVMDYVAGDALGEWLRRNPQPPEGQLKLLLSPLVDGLAAVHRAGFLHRDIKPSNVFIAADGTPVLLDFGAARQSLGGATRSLTAIVTPGYAPLEQYSERGNQGPWSDVYSLAAVLYRALTGENPPDAPSRLKSDPVPQKLAACGAHYRAPLLKATEWGMAVNEGLRPRSVGEWSERVFGADAAAIVPTASAVALRPSAIGAGGASASRPYSRPVRTQPADEGIAPWKWIALIALPLAIIAGGARLLKKSEPPSPPQARTALRAAPAERAAIARERPAARAAASAEALARPDADRGHELSRRELADSMPSIAARFDEIDADHNGRISAQELGRFLEREAEAARRAPAIAAQALQRDFPVLAQNFRAADTDGDGMLSFEETRRGMPQWFTRNFAQIDADRDGRLSPEELLQVERVKRAQQPLPPPRYERN